MDILLNPPKDKGRSLKDLVDYLQRTTIQRELVESVDELDRRMPDLPNVGKIRQQYVELLRKFVLMAEQNTYLFKGMVGKLEQFSQATSSGNITQIQRALDTLDRDVSHIFQDDFSHLGRKVEALERSLTLVPSPRLRAEALINDTDYSLQRFCIDLTTICNYVCLKCFRSEAIDGKNQHIDFDTFKRMVDQALKMGVQDIALLGGEPTLYDHFDDALEFLQQKRREHQGPPFTVILFTNGSRLYASEKRRRLVRESDFLDVWFTIETFDRELYPTIHGSSRNSYDEVMTNLKIALEDGLTDQKRLVITYPQSKHNVAGSEEAWRFSRAYGILPRHSFLCQVGRAKEKLSNRALTDEERANITKTIVAVDATLGYDTVFSYNGIGMNPFRAYNFLAFSADATTWDHYVNIPGLSARDYSIQEIWQMNLERLNDPDFLRAQLGSPYKITKEFAQKRMEELQNGKRL